MEPNPYLDALRRVAAGRTATFAELAELAGRPAAARAAGRAVAAVPTGDPRPWHRIVQSDGSLSPDPDRAAVQIERLRKEGARPRAGEDIRAWARRRRARCVGNWRSRAMYERDDERAARLDPLRVEPLREEDLSKELGFYHAPPPPVAAAPLPGRLRAAAPRDDLLEWMAKDDDFGHPEPTPAPRAARTKTTRAKTASASGARRRVARKGSGRPARA